MSKPVNLQNNVSLSPLTTFKLGGNARFFVKAESDKEIIEAINFTDENKFEIFILGGGSNVLIADDGFDGLVIQIANKGITIKKGTDGKYLVKAMAGEDWDEFVGFCVGKNLAGLECLSGIPGLVGGTPIQNVGAYGQEVSETISNVRVYDRKSKEILELSNRECKFEYRKSIFNTKHKNRFVVLDVTYILEKNGTPKITYKDLLNQFGENQPTLQEIRETVCRVRAEKGMLVRQGGSDSQSAGSFFKNPIVSTETFSEIEKAVRELKLISENEKVPNYEVGNNLVKIPAAWLIEKAGFNKGYKLGNAGLSARHTLALTNRGNATALELIKLKEEIQQKIKEKFGIDLIPEPNFIGFDKNTKCG